MKRKPTKRNKTDGLSKAELALIARLLEEASDDLSNNGCNDYSIPATEENKKIMLEMFEWNGDIDERQDDVAEVLESKDEIDTYDWYIASYLASRCKNLSEKK